MCRKLSLVLIVLMLLVGCEQSAVSSSQSAPPATPTPIPTPQPTPASPVVPPAPSGMIWINFGQAGIIALDQTLVAGETIAFNPGTIQWGTKAATGVQFLKSTGTAFVQGFTAVDVALDGSGKLAENYFEGVYARVIPGARLTFIQPSNAEVAVDLFRGDWGPAGQVIIDVTDPDQLQRLGEGTVVRGEEALAAEDEKPDVRADQEVKPTVQPKLKMAMIDDSPYAADIGRLPLFESYEFRHFLSCQALLNAMEDEAYRADVYVLDYLLNRDRNAQYANGTSCIAPIRFHHSGARIIGFSSHLVGDEYEAQGAGFAWKGASTREFLDAIEALLK